MSKFIKKIKLHNFKKFTDFEIKLDENINILVGDNDAGKSSILTAVDLVLNASNSRLVTVGYESLINAKAIKDFLDGERIISRLPEMWVELYLNEQNKEELEGKNNSDDTKCEGIRLSIQPNESMPTELEEFLRESGDTFPFEYYHSTFTTFSGEQYSSYKKILRTTVIDHTKGSDEYALGQFVRNAYEQNLANQEERAKHQANYRAMKTEFTSNRLSELNARVEGDYKFQLKTSSKSNIDTDLTISENGVTLENYGKGQQVVMKAEITLTRSLQKPDVVLIEEPENHLSHVNMSKLIAAIKSNSGQLIISTHSNLISSRLDLKHCILINSNSNVPLKLDDITEETSEYFMKAPPHNVLDFTLSKKVILVEGAAEYILLRRLYEQAKGHLPSEDSVHIIEVGGTAFRRYLEIAKILDIKTAVLRDNDGDSNQVTRYDEWLGDNQKVFTDQDTDNNTFETSFYNSNQVYCDNLFSSNRRTLSVLEYMLKNKTDAAFDILQNYGTDIVIPEYITEAIMWISE